MRSVKKWLTRLPLVGLGVFALVIFVRLQLASSEVRNDMQALTLVTPLEIGETSTLEVLPLYENAAAQADLQTGPGVSYLIKTDTATVLFDVGDNPNAVSPSPLEQNMAGLGVSLDDVDVVVISHAHPDHVGGQSWLSRQTFALDGNSQVPLGERPVYIPDPMTYPGSDPVLSQGPVRLADGIATTGIIPYVYPFPAWLAIPRGNEQALAVNVKGRGIVLITGCGHMGLESLLAHAQASFEPPVIGVIGGLHYGNANAQTLQSHIQLLQTLSLGVIALSPHDSGPAVLAAFQQAFPTTYQNIRVGQAIHIP
jgi:7,8-dihydropterin-6-yl-methyl-4-(beta-D-ribofuranosyl)aminobenzene 5'-phosphate synthase